METRHGTKYRQLHIEDYLREIPAEQGKVTGVYAHEWITGNPDTNTDFWTDNLLDTILRSDNLNAVYKKVKANKGSGGIDGIFVRYADDCMILCKSRKSAERTLKHIIQFITEKLYLKINHEKTTVSHISKVKYLGYGFYRYKGKCRMRVHPKLIRKMKNRLRELTVRGNKWSNPEREEKLRKYTDGWINYYRFADMENLMKTTDEWLRHRIRAVYWKQWKRIRTRYRIFRALHLPEWQAHKIANCRKGTWRAAELLNSVLTKTIIVDRLGYPSMTAHYLKVRVNY